MAQSSFVGEVQLKQTYYDSLISQRGADSMQGTGYLQYQRWYNYWAPKLLPDLDISDYQLSTIENAAGYTQEALSPGEPKWRLIGPSDNTNNSAVKYGPGQIHFICEDTHDNSGNTLMAASPTGGLFRSTDGGENWINAGTDLGLFKSGVSSVVIDELAYGTWYVTTGNGEAYGSSRIWQNSIGVWRTKDLGSTWENIGLDYYIDSSNGDTNLIYNMRKAVQVPSGGNTKLAVATTAGLFLCENALDEQPLWEMLIKGDFYDVERDLLSDTIIYASGSDTTGVFKIDLNNKTYEKLLDPDSLNPYGLDSMDFKRVRRLSIEISPAAPNYLFAIYTQRDFAYSRLLRYDINTGTWSFKGELPSDEGPGGQAFNGYERTLGWDIMPDTNNAGQLCLLSCNVRPFRKVCNLLDDQDTVLYYDLSAVSNDKPHDDCHYIWINGNDIWAGTDGGAVKGHFVNDTTMEWEARNKGLGVSNMGYIDVSSDGMFLTSGQYDCGSNYYETADETSWTSNFRNGGDGYQTIINSPANYYMSSQEGQIIHLVNGNSSSVSAGSGNVYFNTHFQNVYETLYLAGKSNVMRYDGNSWNDWSDFENLSKYPDMGPGKSMTWQTEVYTNSIMYVSTLGNPPENYYYFHVFKYKNNPDNDWDSIANQPFSSWVSAVETNGLNPNGSVYVSTRNKIYEVSWTNNDVSNAVWQDISSNLDSLTVQQINTIKWKSYGMFIGTDRGVFYKEKGSGTWERYGNLLPNVEVKDVEVANNRVYAGTYGRGLWFASAPTCANSGIADTIANSTTVNSTTTLEFFNDVIIPPGITYTVKGTVKMGTGCRIVVQRGAKLIVDGGTLTNACPDFWEGIDVWGNSNAVQDTINQGWVILKNNALVQYARQAITTVKNENGLMDITYAGGVVQADDATFLNNRVSVVFHPYPKSYAMFPLMNNASYFKKCTFEYDGAYLAFDNKPLVHMVLNEVMGILLESNVFENSIIPHDIDYDKRGTGIEAWNSGFLVKASSVTGLGNTFSKLNYGIKSYAYTNSNRLIEIEGNTFNNNNTACYLSAENNCAVNGNIFNGNPANPFVNTNTTGLYLDNCTGYQVEENTFYSNDNPQSAINRAVVHIGLVVNNSGPEDNMIYKNNFHNLRYATIAQNHNRDKGRQTGLQYKCNVFQDNYQDIAVTWDGAPSSLNGIAENQGSAVDTVTAPAGNLFSQAETWSYSDFDNEGEYVWYHMPKSSISLQFKIVPKSSDTIKVKRAFNIDIYPWRPLDGCPSHPNEKTKNALNIAITTNEIYQTFYTDSLEIKTDAGNTTSLNLDVATSLPPETMQLRDQLLGASPYLSDTVMVNSAAKEDVLPNSIITEVL
ncbi:MAG: hypothetical protein GXO88_02700, partial [Chlorobi bacterium]|nr:hypothetical protein [Chlorobiota bacterium]